LLIASADSLKETPVEFKLQGRVAVVTGASVGIGRAIAKSLGHEGLRTVLVARRSNLMEELAREIVQAGGLPPLVVPLDLYDRDSPAALADTLRQHSLHADILVNDAGGSRPLPIDAEDDAWDESFAINFTALRKLTQALLPGMIGRRWGRVVNITGSTEPSGVNAANAAKAAVHAWAKGLSRKIGTYNITINSITPGRIHSEQIDKRLFPTPEAQEAFARENIPMGYFGDPEDVANLATFLCSERARYLTGQRICVDGGLHRAVT
jgi:3-oxoacyl-[acyl-carrier protein] reductase